MDWPRLSSARLDALDAHIERPLYDRSGEPPGVVHLGVGNFHRAHQAAAFDALARLGDARWGVCGVSVRRSAMRDALQPQDGLYTVVERDAQGSRARIIGALREVLVAPESPDAVRARLASKHTRLVTLTVTEKGYDEAGAGSALALLTDGLAARQAAGVGGLTLMSCDNLAANGAALRARLLALASTRESARNARRGESLASWIEREVACPHTMVDRIVPATTDADRQETARLTGVYDAWPVVTEPFSQWVIETAFRAEPPALERVGAQWVSDVSAWESMKLRLLNAAHSSLAYLGVPLGLTTVDRAVAEPALRQFLDQLWHQVMPTLPASVRVEAPTYTRQLLARFANPALGHALLQISADGSRKLPQRLLATLRDARRLGLPHDALLMGVAAWMQFLSGCPDPAVAPRAPLWTVDDPMADRLVSLARGARTAHEAVSALLAVHEVFGDDLREDAALVDALAGTLHALHGSGTVAALSSLASRS